MHSTNDDYIRYKHFKEILGSANVGSFFDFITISTNSGLTAKTQIGSHYNRGAIKSNSNANNNYNTLGSQLRNRKILVGIWANPLSSVGSDFLIDTGTPLWYDRLKRKCQMEYKPIWGNKSIMDFDFYTNNGKRIDTIPIHNLGKIEKISVEFRANYRPLIESSVGPFQPPAYYNPQKEIQLNTFAENMSACINNSITSVISKSLDDNHFSSLKTENQIVPKVGELLRSVAKSVARANSFKTFAAGFSDIGHRRISSQIQLLVNSHIHEITTDNPALLNEYFSLKRKEHTKGISNISNENGNIGTSITNAFGHVIVRSGNNEGGPFNKNSTPIKSDDILGKITDLFKIHPNTKRIENQIKQLLVGSISFPSNKGVKKIDNSSISKQGIKSSISQPISSILCEVPALSSSPNSYFKVNSKQTGRERKNGGAFFSGSKKFNLATAKNKTYNGVIIKNTPDYPISVSTKSLMEKQIGNHHRYSQSGSERGLFHRRGSPYYGESWPSYGLGVWEDEYIGNEEYPGEIIDKKFENNNFQLNGGNSSVKAKILSEIPSLSSVTQKNAQYTQNVPELLTRTQREETKNHKNIISSLPPLTKPILNQYPGQNIGKEVPPLAPQDVSTKVPIKKENVGSPSESSNEVSQMGDWEKFVGKIKLEQQKQKNISNVMKNTPTSDTKSNTTKTSLNHNIKTKTPATNIAKPNISASFYSS